MTFLKSREKCAGEKFTCAAVSTKDGAFKKCFSMYRIAFKMDVSALESSISERFCGTWNRMIVMMR